MEERKWEYMNRDCLVHIISKVRNTDYMLKIVPFVCKSWYDATLDPKCWQILVFPEREVSTEYVKLVVARSHRTAIELFFPGNIPLDGFIYISDECPELKVLFLSDYFITVNSSQINEQIGKCKNLEFFGKTEDMDLYIKPIVKHFNQILESISLHCPNFSGLHWQNVSYWEIKNGAISSIIKFLPKIKSLDLSYACLSKNDIMMLLEGCKDLENLQVIKCVGFRSDDNEIEELASHIKHFSCNGIITDHFCEGTYNACVQELLQFHMEQIFHLTKDLGPPAIFRRP